MLCIDETQSFLNATLADELGDRVRDVEVVPPMRRFEPEMFGEGFHGADMPFPFQVWQHLETRWPCVCHK